MTKNQLFTRDGQTRLIICNEKDIKEYFIPKHIKDNSMNDFVKIINNANNKVYAFKQLTYEEYNYFTEYNIDYIKYSLEVYE